MTPGGVEPEQAVDAEELGVEEASGGIRGGGGGRGKGESCDGIGAPGAEGTTTLAFFFNSWIFVLYASLSSLTSLSPCLECLSVSHDARDVSVAITSRGILFGLPIKLLLVSLYDPIRFSMGGNETYIMNLRPSPLRDSQARHVGSENIPEGRLSDGGHGRADMCKVQ